MEKPCEVRGITVQFYQTGRADIGSPNGGIMNHTSVPRLLEIAIFGRIYPQTIPPSRGYRE
jgi:hypothetical protein